MRLIIGVAIVAWFVIGTAAAVQRGYFGNDHAVNCRTGATTGLTILAGPLDYAGVNPKVNCRTPRPSS